MKLESGAKVRVDRRGIFDKPDPRFEGMTGTVVNVEEQTADVLPDDGKHGKKPLWFLHDELTVIEEGGAA